MKSQAIELRDRQGQPYIKETRLALYAFFILRKKNCSQDARSCRGCTDCFLDFQGIRNCQREITELYRQISGSRDLLEMSDTGITSLNMENFNSHKLFRLKSRKIWLRYAKKFFDNLVKRGQPIPYLLA